MKKLILLMIVGLFIFAGCQDKAEDNYEPKLNEFGLLVDQYQDSIFHAKNKVYRNEYINRFEEKAFAYLNKDTSFSWKGTYEYDSMDGDIVHFNVHLGSYTVHDYAAENTNPDKYNIVKDLKDGDSINIYGKPYDFDMNDFPINTESFGYEWRTWSIYFPSDSISIIKK